MCLLCRRRRRQRRLVLLVRRALDVDARVHRIRHGGPTNGVHALYGTATNHDTSHKQHVDITTLTLQESHDVVGADAHLGRQLLVLERIASVWCVIDRSYTHTICEFARSHITATHSRLMPAPSLPRP
jgi:hypothetical protein